MGAKYQVSDARDRSCLLRSPTLPVTVRMPVVMVTPGHMACGVVTAMRLLSGALSNRYRQEDAACHHPVRGGGSDGPARHRAGHPGQDHAACPEAAGGRLDSPRAGGGCGGRRVRPDRAGDLRRRPAADASGGPDDSVHAGRAARRTQGGPRAGEARASRAREAAGQPGARRRLLGLRCAQPELREKPGSRDCGPLPSRMRSRDARAADAADGGQCV
jgi:hypothetical protein